jgi:hypothetical protein
MSHVTDVIVTCSLLDKDKLPAVNEYFRRKNIADGSDGTKYVALVDAGAAWDARSERMGKALQACVWVGAFNYMDHRPFLGHLLTVPWRDPEAVQVFMNFENGERGFQRVEWRQEQQMPDDTSRWMEP